MLFFKEVKFSLQSLCDVLEDLKSEFDNIIASVRNSSYAGQPEAHSSSLAMVFFEKLQDVIISPNFWF